MKKTLFTLFVIVYSNLLAAQNTNLKNASSICGNGIVEPGEECDGTPGCTSTCTLIPAGTFFVEPSYGVKYISNSDPAIKSSNRSLKLDVATNVFGLITNRHTIPNNYSFGGTSLVNANGENSNSTSITGIYGGNLDKNFPLPIAGNDYVGNLLGEGTNLKGIEIRDLYNPYILRSTIIPADILENNFDIFAATKQADGKILLAGRCTLSQGRMIIIRLNTNYSFDTTFNNSGYIKLSFGSDCQARAIGVQSEGKIIVAGHRTSPGSQGIVARLNTNGTVDTTFGDNGSKIFNYEINTQNNYFLLNTSSEVYSMFIADSGNIYLCGAGSAANLWNGKTIPAFRGFTSSGADWITMNDLTHTTATSLFNVEGSAYKILANADESFYLGGFSRITTNKGLYLQLFNSVGNVNTTFNFKTTAVHGFYDISIEDDIIYDMAKQNDGKIILVGESNNAGFYTKIMTATLETTSFSDNNNRPTLWPNPITNTLNLTFENSINEKTEITISDVFGKEVFRLSNPVFNTQKTIAVNNLDALPSGLFFVKIVSASKFQVLKFIKK